MSSPDDLRETFPYLPDVQKDQEESDDSSCSPLVSPVKKNRKRSKSTKAWATTINDKSRIISQGDLRFHIGMNVIAVLPYYFDLDTNVVKKNFVVDGIITEIFYREVGTADIPRETKLRSSPIPDIRSKGSVEMSWSKFESLKQTSLNNLDWAKPMISDYRSPLDPNKVQTIVTSYQLTLNKEHILSKAQIMKLESYVSNDSLLPYKYNLSFKENEDGEFDTIMVNYRYVMGLKEKVFRKLKTLEPSIRKPKVYDVNRYLASTLQIENGSSIIYNDSDPRVPKGGRVCRFMVVDHICLDPFDIRFVIKPLDDPRRILAINKLIDFDVRLHYNIDHYYCFNPYDKMQYNIVEPYDNPLSKIRGVLRELFSNLRLFTVKKSLKSTYEPMLRIYEKKNSKEVVYMRPGIKMEGFEETNIEVGRYVKGLAYPEKQLPLEHDKYIFFESKNYRGLDLDPTSLTFMEMVPVAGEKIYRDPRPGEILMGKTFICDKDNFKGKENLEWFYPGERIQILRHVFVNSSPIGENHPQIRRDMFEGISLFMFDLWIYGIGNRNPTRDSEFSKAFMSRYLWQALLKSQIEEHSNYKYQSE